MTKAGKGEKGGRDGHAGRVPLPNGECLAERVPRDRGGAVGSRVPRDRKASAKRGGAR